MSQKKRVYIAGPYTKGDTVLNVRMAIFMGDQVASLGFAPFIPHLSHFWHTVSPHPYDFWIDQDNQFLTCCDALLRFPGESKGADDEWELAKQHGIPVFDNIADLVNAFPEVAQ